MCRGMSIISPSTKLTPMVEDEPFGILQEPIAHPLVSWTTSTSTILVNDGLPHVPVEVTLNTGLAPMKPWKLIA